MILDFLRIQFGLFSFRIFPLLFGTGSGHIQVFIRQLDTFVDKPVGWNGLIYW